MFAHLVIGVLVIIIVLARPLSPPGQTLYTQAVAVHTWWQTTGPTPYNFNNTQFFFFFYEQVIFFEK